MLVPVTLPDRDLDWVALPGDIALSVSAIAAADAVLVPALAVAPDGTRLGRGGGSYDRALARVHPGVPIAALVYDGEVRARLPRDPWDVPVSAYVTPSGGWREVADAARALGYRVAGQADSRLAGPKGNREVFLHLLPGAADPGEQRG